MGVHLGPDLSDGVWRGADLEGLVEDVFQEDVLPPSSVTDPVHELELDCDDMDLVALGQAMGI